MASWIFRDANLLEVSRRLAGEGRRRRGRRERGEGRVEEEEEEDVGVGDRKEEERKDRGEYSVTVVDDCQSIRESASREYRGWLPSLLDEQLYLSSTS